MLLFCNTQIVKPQQNCDPEIRESNCEKSVLLHSKRHMTLCETHPTVVLKC